MKCVPGGGGLEIGGGEGVGGGSTAHSNSSQPGIGCSFLLCWGDAEYSQPNVSHQTDSAGHTMLGFAVLGNATSTKRLMKVHVTSG